MRHICYLYIIGAALDNGQFFREAWSSEWFWHQTQAVDAIPVEIIYIISLFGSWSSMLPPESITNHLNNF